MLIEEESGESGLDRSGRHFLHGGLERFNGSFSESVGSQMMRRSENMANGIPADKFLKNSALVNGVPLSDTNISGRPWVANRILSLSMVVCDEHDRRV